MIEWYTNIWIIQTQIQAANWKTVEWSIEYSFKIQKQPSEKFFEKRCSQRSRQVTDCKYLPILKLLIISSFFQIWIFWTQHLPSARATYFSVHKKWSFPLRISSVNVTESTGICGFGHIYWRILKKKLHFLCSVCLLKSIVINLFKFNTIAVKQSSFISSNVVFLISF